MNKYCSFFIAFLYIAFLFTFIFIFDTILTCKLNKVKEKKHEEKTVLTLLKSNAVYDFSGVI